jgi:hypothetical protein
MNLAKRIGCAACSAGIAFGIAHECGALDHLLHQQAQQHQEPMKLEHVEVDPPQGGLETGGHVAAIQASGAAQAVVPPPRPMIMMMPPDEWYYPAASHIQQHVMSGARRIVG